MNKKILTKITGLVCVSACFTACEVSYDISRDGRFREVLSKNRRVTAKRTLNLYPDDSDSSGRHVLLTGGSFINIPTMPLIARIPKGHELIFLKATRESSIGGAFDHLEGRLWFRNKDWVFWYPLGFAGAGDSRWENHIKYNLDIH